MKLNTKIVLSLAAIMVLSILSFGGIVLTQHSSAIRRIRNAGDPVSLLDLKPKLVSPYDNAATYLDSIADDAAKLYSKIFPYSHADQFSWRIGLSQSETKKIEEGFASYPRVNAMLDKAAECTELVRKIDYTLTPSQFIESLLKHIQASREFARVSDGYARYLASTGRPDEATKIYLRQLCLTRLQERDPLFVSFEVNSACVRIAESGLNGLLQTSTLSRESHEAIEVELQKHNELNRVVRAFKSERAFAIDSLRGFYGNLHMYFGQSSSVLDVLEQQIKLGAKPQFATSNISPVYAEGLAEIMQLSLTKARETANQLEANLRCLRILNAIIAKGTRSETVDVNSLGLPDEILVDPFSGNPLLNKLLPSGWTVYSVGQDGIDNGGQLKDLKDTGFGPPEEME